MRILVTNDDGVQSEGIKLLTKKLKKYASELVVVAPSSQKSAVSHGIALFQGIKVEKINDLIEGVKTYSVDGTPADCVLIAKSCLKFNYDVVFSGCNNGYNLSYDILYSGTVAGAREAAVNNKKGVAISCDVNQFKSLDAFDIAMEYILKTSLLDKSEVLNINFPLNAKGVKLSFQGKSDYQSRYRLDKDGLYYATFASPQKMINTDSNADWEVIKDGYISITPLQINSTDFQLYNAYKSK